MTEGKCACLLISVLLVACVETPPPQAGNDMLDESPEIRSWLAGINGEASVQANSAVTTSAPPVDEMIGGLEQRLLENSNDLKGWRLLAQSYAFTGDMKNARSAADKAVALGADAAEIKTVIVSAHMSRSR